MKNSNNFSELFFSENSFPDLIVFRVCELHIWLTFIFPSHFFSLSLFLKAIDKSCHRRSKKLLADNLLTHPQNAKKSKISFFKEK